MASHIPSTSYASSFENPFANEAPLAQHAVAPSRPMTRPEIERELTAWARDAGPNEKRIEAKDLILAAYDNSEKELRLNSLGLTCLPDCIGQLSDLQTLSLIFNQLTTLPESIGQLSNLQTLFLWHNQLTSLPESIGQLSNLQTLNLWANKITTLPSSLKNFWENRKFTMHLDCIPQKTCQEEYGNVTYFGPEPTQVAASTSASPLVPLMVRLSFAEKHAEHTANGLHLAHVPQGEQVLSLKVLPPALQNNPICAQFFGDYAQAMQQLYNKKTADALGYSNIEASPWSRIANAVLTTTGILGLSVCGRLLTNLSQLHNETEAANKAHSMLGHFCLPHQFDALSNHLAVRLTQALEPQLDVLLSQPTQNTLNPLKQKVNEWMQSWQLKPIEHLSPFALLTAMVCMKLLRKTPSADRQTQLNDNYLTELTENLVSRVLDIMNTEGATTGPSTLYTDFDDVCVDVYEVPSSTQPPRGSDQPAQQSLAEIAEIANAALQTAQSTGAKVNQLAQAVQRQDLLGNGRMQHQTHVNVNIMGGHAVATPHETQRTVTAIDPEARQVIRDTNQRVDYHDERLNLIEGALEGSGQNFSSDASSHYSSTHRYGSGSSTSRRTQMDLNRLPSNWRQAEFTLPNITSISADYLSNHDQANGAVSFTKGQWKVQVKGLRGNLGLTKWKVLSKALQEVHRGLPADRYTIAHDLNTLLVTKLPDTFSRAANILIPANEERLQNSIQTVLGRVQNA